MVTVYNNARVVTGAGPAADARLASEEVRALHDELGIIDNGFVVVANGRVVDVGAGQSKVGGDAHVMDCQGRLLTPALVDCHTHALFAGTRIRDFRDKMAGIAYETIAARGGGIQSTVRATSLASDQELVRRVQWAQCTTAHRHGVGTLEVKTGYGGAVVQELRLLDVLLHAATQTPDDHHAKIMPTWLGLHGPPDGERGAYLAGHLEVLASVRDRFAQAGFMPVVDVYLDANAYSAAECRSYLTEAKRHGFAIRGHVGQFADLGGVELLASLGARSCDHLEAVSDAGLSAMSAANTTAVLLPGAWRTLRQTPPDAQRFARAGVSVAVASDYNPGTSPTFDLQLCAALAVRDAGLHPDAALLSITRRAADVLDIKAGRIAEGYSGNLVLWDTDDPAAFGYHLGGLRPWDADDEA